MASQQVTSCSDTSSVGGVTANYHPGKGCQVVDAWGDVMGDDALVMSLLKVRPCEKSFCKNSSDLRDRMEEYLFSLFTTLSIPLGLLSLLLC